MIALGVQPAYSHFAFVDNDSVCVDALERRGVGLTAKPHIKCADSNDSTTIAWVIM